MNLVETIEKQVYNDNKEAPAYSFIATPIVSGASGNVIFSPFNGFLSGADASPITESDLA